MSSEGQPEQVAAATRRLANPKSHFHPVEVAFCMKSSPFFGFDGGYHRIFR